MRFSGLILLFLLAGCATAPSQHAAATTAASVARPASPGTTESTSPRIELPLPRLTPQSFHGSANLLQRLVISRLDGKAVPDQLIEVMLEIDPKQLRMAGLAFGQRVMLIEWDGKELQSWRHPRLPDSVDSERVLRDVQFVYWPAGAVSSVLPVGWKLIDANNERVLTHDGATVLRVKFNRSPRWTAHAELENFAEGYRIDIDSTTGGHP
jgi:hypothetical protein